MNVKFSWRYTADARPILMLEVLVQDEHGFRLFSWPALEAFKAWNNA